MEQIINQVLFPVLATVLTAVFSYIGMKLKSLYEEKVNTDIKKKIVEDTVKYIEQVYANLDGKEKLKEAIATASSWLEDRGIHVGTAELTVLIEAAVNALTADFELNKEIKKDKVQTLKEGE